MAPTLTGEWKRCSPEDPNRCQASGMNGQCPYLARAGHKFCERHSAVSDMIAAKAAANRYQLQQYQERMTNLTVDSEIKNLRAEIGILRMTLEQIILACHGDDDIFVAYSGKISDTVVKIGNLVKTCQRLETQMGQMLDRDKVMLIGQKIVEIVAKVVTEPEKLDFIGDEIVAAILQIANPDYKASDFPVPIT